VQVLLFCSCKKANYGVPYFRGEKIARHFNEWRKQKELNNLWLYYAISHCADYPELTDNIELINPLFFGYLLFTDYWNKFYVAGRSNKDE